jgi:phosphoribosyl 1,2-cyclic phosphodiesterase
MDASQHLSLVASGPVVPEPAGPRHVPVRPTVSGKLGGMEILLLGTGAADGIPNPFCACLTCADYRDRGELRTPTSVLIDNRLLIDPGPEAPRQVSRLGRTLLSCTTMLVSHAHSDHLDPAVLLHRSWVTGGPLHLIGPAPVIEWSANWLSPTQTSVRFSTLTAGQVIETDGYTIRALAANHHAYTGALCYAISDASSTLLYLTDTGLLPAETVAAVAGVAVDLILLEETFGTASDKGDQHLNLTTFAATMAQLRAAGTIGDATVVAPIHLGHDNPPLAQLRQTMAALGAQVFGDGCVIRLG